MGRGGGANWGNYHGRTSDRYQTRSMSMDSCIRRVVKNRSRAGIKTSPYTQVYMVLLHKLVFVTRIYF